MQLNRDLENNLLTLRSRCEVNTLIMYVSQPHDKDINYAGLELIVLSPFGGFLQELPEEGQNITIDVLAYGAAAKSRDCLDLSCTSYHGLPSLIEMRYPRQKNFLLEILFSLVVP